MGRKLAFTAPSVCQGQSGFLFLSLDSRQSSALFLFLWEHTQIVFVNTTYVFIPMHIRIWYLSKVHKPEWGVASLWPASGVKAREPWTVIRKLELLVWPSHKGQVHYLQSESQAQGGVLLYMNLLLQLASVTRYSQNVPAQSSEKTGWGAGTHVPPPMLIPCKPSVIISLMAAWDFSAVFGLDWFYTNAICSVPSSQPHILIYYT